MSLRLGVDLDGTLADLSSVYREYDRQLFGESSPRSAEAEDESEASDRERLASAKRDSARREAVWKALRATNDLWTKLEPIENGAVSALYAAATKHLWEVFFITQRPQSAGATVQDQTQRWLIAQGFNCPSVLTLTGSRGKAANALDLDFLIDDLPKNCIDVVSDSKCQPILVLRDADDGSESAARRMNIAVVGSVVEAIELLARPALIPRETAIRKILASLGLLGARP